jgi:hypothetical protein
MRTLFNQKGTNQQGFTSKMANQDIQNYLDQKQKLPHGMVPFVMFTEEMYKANFILDRWLKGKTGLDAGQKQEEVQTKGGAQEENPHRGFENEDDDAHFDDWKGVSREGDRSDGQDDDEHNNNRRDDNDDNDGNDGGVMMPIPDASF